MDYSTVEPQELDTIHLDFRTSVNLGHLSGPEVEALERDLALAAQVQRHLFPCCVPALEHLEVAAHLKPAGIVSGDFFDFFRYKESGQGMLVADVMGKGLPAGMIMASIQASMRILGTDYQDVDAMVTRLNTLFKEQMKTGVFTSMVVITYDLDAGSLQYTNAGHLPPLLWRHQTQSIEWLTSTGPAIGLMNAPSYRSERVDMEPGDVMILYTDGLVEARNRAGDEFDIQRLASFITDHHEKSAQALVAELNHTLHAFTEGCLVDDLTLLVLKWK